MKRPQTAALGRALLVAVSAAARVDARDAVAVLGLGLLGIGVAGALSVWIALIVVGCLLIAAVMWPEVAPILVQRARTSGSRAR